MAMIHNPAHPGEILREDVLPALGLSVTEAADALGVNRVSLSRVLNGRAAISSEMALRLEKWLGPDNGPEAKTWLAMQAQYDLWHASKQAASKIRKIKPATLREGPAGMTRERAAA
jgi:addiction module HigA family antidote